MESKKIEDTLDHIEMVNWIHFMSYWAAGIGRTMQNIEGRPFLELPSGKKVVITIKVEEFKDEH